VFVYLFVVCVYMYIHKQAYEFVNM